MGNCQIVAGKGIPRFSYSFSMKYRMKWSCQPDIPSCRVFTFHSIILYSRSNRLSDHESIGFSVMSVTEESDFLPKISKLRRAGKGLSLSLWHVPTNFSGFCRGFYNIKCCFTVHSFSTGHSSLYQVCPQCDSCRQISQLSGVAAYLK